MGLLKIFRCPVSFKIDLKYIKIFLRKMSEMTKDFRYPVSFKIDRKHIFNVGIRRAKKEQICVILSPLQRYE